MVDSVNEIRIKQLESRVAALETVVEQYQKKFDDFVTQTQIQIQTQTKVLQITGDVKMNEIGEAIFVSGKDTYKYKGILKQMGGKWESRAKCWVFEKESRNTLVAAGIR